MIKMGKNAAIVYTPGCKVICEDKIGEVVNLGYKCTSLDDGPMELYYDIEFPVGNAMKTILSFHHKQVTSFEPLQVSLSEEPVQQPVNEDLSEDPIGHTLEDLGKCMTTWMWGLEKLPDNSKLPAIVTMLMAIQYDKEQYYGSSWKGKGEYRGIMANIDRKYDRLDKMTNDEIANPSLSLAEIERSLANLRFLNSEQSKAKGESKIDAIADLANYCLLYMTYVRENYPLMFQQWVDKNVPNYLAKNIPFCTNDQSQV